MIPCQLVERLRGAWGSPPVRGRRALEQRHVALRERGAPAWELGIDRCEIQPFAEEEVPQTLHRGLARPMLGPSEALGGQLVTPDVADALDERVEIEPVGREEERAVDVEEQ